MDGLARYVLLLTWCVAVPAFNSGCHLLGRREPPPAALPAVLSPEASLSQVIEAVNKNSRGIHSFSTDEAELSGPAMPIRLRGANIAFERPRRLRIQAGTALTSELDFGSNDELFWIWIARNEPPAVFFCRHDQYASCEASRVIPMEPGWFIEALGITEFDPNERHRGPIRRSDGRLEILTERQTPCGPATKKTVIDATTAVVHEQHLYDYRGQLVASAVVREHRMDPLTGLVMPKIVDLQCPQAQFSMRVNLGNVTINQPVASAALWTMPRPVGAPLVNLADPNWRRALGRQPGLAHTTRPPPGVSSVPATSLDRRGLNRLQ